MRRRAVLAILVFCLVVLGAAVAPWTLSSDTVRAAVSGRLKELYGLELSVGGRSTIALLPVPRFKFENVTLTAPDGKPVVRGGWLRGELRVLPMLAARLDLSELSLTDGVIEVEVGQDGRTSWDRTTARFREALTTDGAGGHIRRLALKGSELHIRDRRTGSETSVRGVNLLANWPTAESPLDVAGSLTWHGEPVELTAASVRPSALAAGRSGRFNLQASAPLARLTLSGDLSWRHAVGFLGRSSFETQSLRDFSRWSGLDLPLGPLIQAFALDGDIVVDGQEVSWPTARLTVSGDRLEGALSARLEGERRKVSGTLAANRLDLTAFAAPLLQARSRSGGWSSDGIDLHGHSGTDLDLRVSAATARIGTVRVEDLAANISVKGSRYEAAVGHASINKGVVKGRATLANAAEGVEVKGQSSFERLDLASFLTDMGLSRWVGGLAQGQFAFEGAGDTAAEIVRNLHGKASVTVRQGELVGVGLNEALRRTDGRPSSTSRWSRMSFDQAHLNVTILDGTAEISNGGLAGAGLRAAVQGRASLSDRMVAVKANVEGNGPSPAVVVEVAGPWDNVAIVPDGGWNGSTSNPSASVQ